MGEHWRSRPSPPPPPPPPPYPARTPSPIQYEVIFQEASDVLPEPLPSPETIENSPLIKDLGCRRTAQVGESYVVKYGIDVERIEGDNAIFIQQHSNIRVPRVFAMYERPNPSRGTLTTFIIMEYIPGDTLEKIWAELSDVKKTSIAKKLRSSFQSLRRLPSEGFFGSLGKTKLRDGIFYSDEPNPAINGPFTTEDALTNGMIEMYTGFCGDRMSHKASYYSRHLPNLLRGTGEPVFTHGDFQPKNIIIQPSGDIALIDWAESGWYPSYWEYATAIFAGRWNDDWADYVDEILERFPNHYAWIHMMRHEMIGSM